MLCTLQKHHPLKLCYNLRGFSYGNHLGFAITEGTQLDENLIPHWEVLQRQVIMSGFQNDVVSLHYVVLLDQKQQSNPGHIIVILI